MAQKKKTALMEKRGKKKWFSLLAPAVFNQKQLPDIIAFEPNELVGRKVEVSLKEFTGNPKDAARKIVLKIIKVQGDTANTEADRFFVSDSYVQRANKKYKTRIEIVQKAKTKDGRTVKIKSLLLLNQKVIRAVKTKLAKLVQETIEKEAGKKSSQEIFTQQFLDKALPSSKRAINKIYPVAKALIWKVILTV